VYAAMRRGREAEEGRRGGPASVWALARHGHMRRTAAPGENRYIVQPGIDSIYTPREVNTSHERAQERVEEEERAHEERERRARRVCAAVSLADVRAAGRAQRTAGARLVLVVVRRRARAPRRRRELAAAHRARVLLAEPGLRARGSAGGARAGGTGTHPDARLVEPVVAPGDLLQRVRILILRTRGSASPTSCARAPRTSSRQIGQRTSLPSVFHSPYVPLGRPAMTSSAAACGRASPIRSARCSRPS
jgi:hypothetical protein